MNRDDEIIGLLRELSTRVGRLESRMYFDENSLCATVQLLLDRERQRMDNTGENKRQAKAALGTVVANIVGMAISAGMAYGIAKSQTGK